MTSHAAQLREISEAQAKVQAQMNKLLPRPPPNVQMMAGATGIPYLNPPIPSMAQPILPGFAPMTPFPLPPQVGVPPLPPHLNPSYATIPPPSAIAKKQKLITKITSIHIQVPKDPMYQDTWQFRGQIISLDLGSESSLATTTVEMLKDKIQETLGVPSSRQKLSLSSTGGSNSVSGGGGGIVLKNTQVLGELGFSEDCPPLLVLSLKERGGKK